jgi:hypothetical protein
MKRIDEWWPWTLSFACSHGGGSAAVVAMREHGRERRSHFSVALRVSQKCDGAIPSMKIPSYSKRDDKIVPIGP